MNPAVRYLLTNLGSAYAPSDPSALAILSAMTVQPSQARYELINQTVTNLKGAGVWDKLDSLFLLSAHDEQAARIDWKVPTRIAVPIASPSFTADRGFTFNGTTSYLQSGFVPSTMATQATGTQGFLGVYERVDLSTTRISAGASTATTANIAINPRTPGGLCAGQWNHAATGNQVPSADNKGLWVVQRNGANIEYFYKGTSQGSKTPTTTGSALVSVQVYIGANNNNGNAGTFSSANMAASVVGGLLTAQQHSNLNEILLAYLTSVGGA